LGFKHVLSFLRFLLPLLPKSGEHVAILEDRDEDWIIFLPNPREASGAGVVVTELARAVMPCAEPIADGGLAFGQAVEVAHV
jgi:hypothetical protein